MKKVLFTAIVASLVAVSNLPAQAGTDMGSKAAQESKPQVTTEAAQTGATTEQKGTAAEITAISASQLASMQPDSQIKLEGYIEKSLGSDKYQFRDSTGTAVIEIETSDWQSQQFKTTDLVIITGEVKLDANGTIVEADKVDKKA